MVTRGKCYYLKYGHFKGVCVISKEADSLMVIRVLRLELSLAMRKFSIYQSVGI